MKIIRYPDAADFLSHTVQYLTRDEARYGLIMGLARILVNNPHAYGKYDPWFCSIGTETELQAIAMRTPPRNVLLAQFSGNTKAVAECLVDAVSRVAAVIPGVAGDKELADIFTRRWCAAYGVAIQHTTSQRIYRLVRVNDVSLSQGRSRPASMADKGVVGKWARAFGKEAGGGARNIPEKDITPVIEHGWVFLWEDGQPVAMVMKNRPTDKGMAVSYVYTPPEFRCRGYATSCVAELCRHILQSGYQFCTLYTDLANPTSNSIYMKIGFKPVGDSVQHTFEMPPESV
jgi:predicted GNAT family acetyltransferase